MHNEGGWRGLLFWLGLRYKGSLNHFLEILMKHHTTLGSFVLTAALLGAAVGVSAQTGSAGASPSAPAGTMTTAQTKAMQDLAAAQAAMEKANKDAADAQAKAKAKAAQDALADKARAAQLAALCETCGIVKELRSEKRKGKGGALGILGGAVAGGVLGNQVGGGDGKTIATVGGAVGGAILGNEIQKRTSRKTVHISTIQMKDGSTRTYESETAPTWAVGASVKLDLSANTVTKL